MSDPLVNVPPLAFAATLGDGHVTPGFDVAVASNAIGHVRTRQAVVEPWTVAGLEALEPRLEVEASTDVGGHGLLVLGRVGERELVEVVRHHGGARIRVAADTHERAEELADSLRDSLHRPGRADDPRVPVWFWTSTEHGPEPMRRMLHAPAWAEIEHNYPEPVRGDLAAIMAAPPTSARGITLWRGDPGTGKTTALRALAQEWAEHVELHVIVDPEVFLGERASYLMHVLFGDDVDEAWEEGGGPLRVLVESGGDYPPVDAPPVRRRPKAKLVVLEDAGELITADARVAAGQALSRLLNLTDGMLGQGSNVSVLVTTNESIDRLHPAVARPGRGWGHVRFRPLTAEEGNAWLEEAGSAERVDADVSVAELYAIVRGDRSVQLDTL